MILFILGSESVYDYNGRAKILFIKKNLLTIAGFKIVWLSCIFGELYIGSLLGFVFGFFFLIYFLFLDKKKKLNIKTILYFSLIGYFFDSLLSVSGLYKINAQINFLFLPLWFLTLWPCFCCLFINVLAFLKNKKITAVAFGAIFGPLSYYTGVTVGLAIVPNMTVFLLISFYWSFIMFIYSKFF